MTPNYIDPLVGHKSAWQISGESYSSSAEWAVRTNPFDPTDIEALSWNVHLRKHLKTALRHVFHGKIQIHVVDSDGDVTDPDFSELIEDNLKDLEIKSIMRQVYMDCLLYGCGVVSVQYKHQKRGTVTRTLIKEIRYIPASSLTSSPTDQSGHVITPNPLLPGLIIRDGKQECWQKNPYTHEVVKLKKFRIIRNPDAPSPYGESDCLPVFPLLDEIALGELARSLCLQRGSVPMVAVKVADNLPASVDEDKITKAALQMIQNYGISGNFVWPRGIESFDMHAGTSIDPGATIRDIDAEIDAYFSPAAALAAGHTSEQALFGSSQMSRERMWRDYIVDQQKWVEEAWENCLSGLLVYNTRSDTDRLEIRLERPSVDDEHTKRMNEVQLGAQTGVLTKDEIRSNLDDLDVADDEREIDMIKQVGNTGEIAQKRIMKQQRKMADRRDRDADKEESVSNKITSELTNEYTDWINGWIENYKKNQQK